MRSHLILKSFLTHSLAFATPSSSTSLHWDDDSKATLKRLVASARSSDYNTRVVLSIGEPSYKSYVERLRMTSRRLGRMSLVEQSGIQRGKPKNLQPSFGRRRGRTWSRWLVYFVNAWSFILNDGMLRRWHRLGKILIFAIYEAINSAPGVPQFVRSGTSIFAFWRAKLTGFHETSPKFFRLVGLEASGT